MLAFEEAIREGTKMVNLEETLVILTADHSHSFHLVGEPRRLSSLLDLDEGYGPMVSPSFFIYAFYGVSDIVTTFDDLTTRSERNHFLHYQVESHLRRLTIIHLLNNTSVHLSQPKCYMP